MDINIIGKKASLDLYEDFHSETLGKIEKVTILDYVGEGGFGVVFKVKCGTKSFALKTFSGVNLKKKKYECYLHAFKREFKASQRVNHPNITKVYQFGFCKIDSLVDRPYILSDFVDGDTLDSLCYDDLDKIKIAKQMIQGLAIIHKQNIVHRDIKPDNIIINNNLVKILDFGICYFTIATTVLVTKTIVKETGQTIFQYKAPELWEQFKKKWNVKLEQHPHIPELDEPIPSSDVFSLGVVLYNLFCNGKMPYSKSEYEILPTLLDKNFQVVPPKQHNPDIPELWNNLITKCLERDINFRFKNGGEILDFLSKPKRKKIILSAYQAKEYNHKNLEEYKKAIDDYTKAIGLNPQDANAYNNRGQRYDYLEEYDKAIGDYTKAIELNPQLADTYYNRGNSYKKLGKLDLAEKDFAVYKKLKITNSSQHTDKKTELSEIERLTLLHLAIWGFSNFKTTPDLEKLAQTMMANSDKVKEALERLFILEILEDIPNTGHTYQGEVIVNNRNYKVASKGYVIALNLVN